MDIKDHLPTVNNWQKIHSTTWMDLQELVFMFDRPDNMDHCNRLLAQIVRCQICNRECDPAVFQCLYHIATTDHPTTYLTTSLCCHGSLTALVPVKLDKPSPSAYSVEDFNWIEYDSTIYAM